MAFDTLHVKAVEDLLSFKKPSDTHLVIGAVMSCS